MNRGHDILLYDAIVIGRRLEAMQCSRVVYSEHQPHITTKRNFFAPPKRRDEFHGHLVGGHGNKMSKFKLITRKEVAVSASCSVRMPEQSNDYRVVVFGAGGVGKSSLVLRFVKGTFRESYIPTIEDTYRQVISCNKNICTLQITDTTGSHQFPAMQRLSISKGHAFILVYSVTSKQSLEELKPIWEVIREMKGADLATIPVMLVGNKCDEVENREVAASEGEAEANRWSCNFMETSAKTNHNVKELFQELLNMEKNRNISLELGSKKGGRQKIPGPNKLKEKCSVM